ncbi:unnamed protein product [Prunus armeniaca]
MKAEVVTLLLANLASIMQRGGGQSPHRPNWVGLTHSVQIHCPVCLLPTCGLPCYAQQPSPCHCSWCLSLGCCHLPLAHWFLIFYEEGAISKVQLRKLNSLSLAGKEVLLKAVATAVPAFPMTCFRFPEGTCNQINSDLASFWWGNNEDSAGIHWKSWKKLCLAKKVGGLGFRDLSNFNLALLAKQSWRIILNPEAAWVKILKARYFPSTDFLNATKGSRPSWAWVSLLEGRKAMMKEARFQIFSGANTNIWNDVWIPSCESGPVKTLLPIPPQAPQLVQELMDKQNHTWKLDSISTFINNDILQSIRCIPIGHSSRPDRLVWPWNSSGSYTVKSGYHRFHARQNTDIASHNCASKTIIKGWPHTRVEASEGLWPTPPGCGPFTPICFAERKRSGEDEGIFDEYSCGENHSLQIGAFIESTSYTQRVLKESVPPIFQSTEAFQTTMVGSMKTRGKTAAMAKSATAQSHSAHDPAIDMVAPPPLTTAPATVAEHGGTSYQGGLVTTADLGPILEQLQEIPSLPPRSTHAPAHTSNETLARVQLGSTHFSPPDPRSQADLSLRVDQLAQRMDDQSDLMRQLLHQISLAQNLGLGQLGEERRMDERTGRQLNGYPAGQAGVGRQGEGDNNLIGLLTCHKHPRAPLGAD